jgi:hypothetical protein
MSPYRRHYPAASVLWHWSVLSLTPLKMDSFGFGSPKVNPVLLGIVVEGNEILPVSKHGLDGSPLTSVYKFGDIPVA